jgi:hypothetical protein
MEEKVLVVQVEGKASGDLMSILDLGILKKNLWLGV